MRKLLFTSAICLIIFGCTSTDNANMELQPLMEEHAITGIQAVLAQEKPLSDKFQENYFIYGEGIADTTVFQAASLSKVVFSYIALNLYDKGVFDLDTPLMEYYDNGRFASGQDSIYARMLTARHVLAHRTGLKNWAASPSSDAWPTSTITFRKKPYQESDSTIMFTYSGEGFAYLQHTLEHLTGKTLNELATEYVFEPFGMPNSWYGWRESFEGQVTVGHKEDGTPVDVMRYPRANSGYTLMTCAADYVKFLEQLSHGGALKEETFQEMITPQFEDEEMGTRIYEDLPISWGLGVGLTDDGALWHWGDNGTFKSFFVIYPGKNARIMHYVCNSRNGLKILPGMLENFFPTCEEHTEHDILKVPYWIECHYR
jgi:CubicO group peptidase (beta-lactamase class C family)